MNPVSRLCLTGSAGFDRKTIFRGVNPGARLYLKKEHSSFLSLHIMTRRVMLQSVAGPSPILQDSPLPSQKTWMDMISRLENEYGQQKKKKTWKSRSSKKKKTRRRRPTRAQKNTYQTMLLAMTTQPRRGKKTDSHRRHVAS